MTIANDSIGVSSGTAVAVASHTPAGSSKKYQVVILADPYGHVGQKPPTYTAWFPYLTVSASKLYGDFFNSAGSASEIAVNGVWIIPKSDVAVATIIGHGIEIYRTGTVGTGGSALTYLGSSLVSGLIQPKNTANSSLHAAITARNGPTGGANISGAYFPTFVYTEETAPAAYLGPMYNILPKTGAQELTLNTGQGILIKGGGISGLGSLGFMIEFSVTSA